MVAEGGASEPFKSPVKVYKTRKEASLAGEALRALLHAPDLWHVCPFHVAFETPENLFQVYLWCPIGVVLTDRGAEGFEAAFVYDAELNEPPLEDKIYVTGQLTVELSRSEPQAAVDALIRHVQATLHAMLKSTHQLGSK